MNEQPRINKRLVVFLIFSVLLLVGGYVLFYLYNHSFIEITVNGAAKGDVRYILKQGGSSSEFTETRQPVRKMVSRGNLEVTALQDYGSAVAVTKTGGFLQTTQVTLDLAKEKDRAFVGDNPKPCMHFDRLLISWQCEGIISTVAKHLPANNTTPTYASPITSSREPINTESLVQTKQGIYLLTKAVSVEGKQHVLYPVSSDGDLVFEGNIPTPDLAGDKNYRSIKYRGGWLFYSVDGADFFYYENLSEPPRRIETQKPQNENLKLYDVSVVGNNIVSVYNEHFVPETNGAAWVLTNNVRTEETTEDSDEGEKIDRPSPQNQTEVLVSSEQSQRYKLNFTAKQVRVCGQTLICALNGDELQVLDVSDESPSPLYTIPNVQQIEVVEGQLMVVNDVGVMEWDIESQKGYYYYTFGDYRFCGLLTKNRPGVCVEEGGKKSLLAIDAQTNIKTPIDQLMLDIGRLDEVRTVTAYNNYIYVSPNYGEVTFNQQTGSYGYSDSSKSDVNAVIDRALKELNLPSSYQVKQTIR